MMDRRSTYISVLAHTSILIGFVFRYSFIFPLLIWKTLKHSKYSERQARQAAHYQIAVLLILMFISFSAEFLMLYPTTNGRVLEVDELLIKKIELAVYLLFSIYAVYGAFRCSRGEEFRYVLIGKL